MNEVLNKIKLIRQILASNNGPIDIVVLASKVNRHYGIPECLDTQTAQIRSIMAMAYNYPGFFKIEGENVKYVTRSSCEKPWHTSIPSEPAEDKTRAPEPVTTTHIGVVVSHEQEQVPQTVSTTEMPIKMMTQEESITSEQAHRTRNELMSVYREMVADMNNYIFVYRDEDGQTAIDHIRKVARLGLNLDLGKYSDDALESFMLFGNPDSVGTNLLGALTLANQLRLAARLSYIFK